MSIHQLDNTLNENIVSAVLAGQPVYLEAAPSTQGKLHFYCVLALAHSLPPC